MRCATREDLPGVPPHSLEAERAVLGAILLEAAMLPQAIEALTADDFYKDAHRLIYGAVLRLFERREAADVLTVTEELKRVGQLEDVGGPAALATLMEEATVATQFAAYCRIIVDNGQKRTIARVCEAARDAALNSGRPETILETLHAQLPQPTAARDARPAMDAADLLAMQFPEHPGVVEGVIERATLTVIGGPPKRGKSALLLRLLLSRGRSWLGFPTSGGSSLLMQAEIPELKMQGRLRLMTQDGEGPARGSILIVTDRSIRLDALDGQQRVRRLIQHHRPDLVAFDPLARFMAGDENQSRGMGAVIGFLDALIQEYGVTIVLVHHTAKPGKDDPREGGQKLRGSSALFAAADSVLILDREKGGAFVLTFELRHAAEPEPMALRRTDTLGFEPVDAQIPEDVQAVVNLAGSGRRYTDLRRDLQDVTGSSRSTATRLIARARELGLLVQHGDVYRAHGLSEAHPDREPSE